MKHNQDGAINALLLPLIFAVLFLVGAIGFGGWAFASRQDFKNNTDQKVSDAVQLARQQESTLKDRQFAEEEKKPLKDYNGPAELGGLKISYPKTWSGYINDTTGAAQLEGFFHPGTVPSINNPNSSFALRYQIVEVDYNTVLEQLSSSFQAKVSFEPYALPKVAGAIGVKASGQITSNRTGQMVILPLRDKTLKIWTEGDQFTKDFTDTILPNTSFSP